MKLFVKKLLAKYIKYIEIIGYFFVILFIAGLVALSFIKAEDEFVNVNGKYEIEFHRLQFEKDRYILDLRSIPGTTVTTNAPLFELTDDEKFIADRTIQANLESQLKTARKAGQRRLANNLAAVILEIEKKDYPRLNYSVVRSPLEGEFVLLDSSDFIPAKKVIGGVFNFKEALITVTELSNDKRQAKKLEVDQSGLATLKLGPVKTVACSVRVIEMNDSELLLKTETISDNEQLKIADFIVTHPETTRIDVNVNVLVGWKSWMRLIWR